MLETAKINKSVTSPAATYALGLMFLKTGNVDVANMFVLPDRERMFKEIREDYVMHRVLAKALVMWHEIHPTEAWIQSMLTPIMSRNPLKTYFDERTAAEFYLIGKAHLHAIAGACLALGLRFASTQNNAARELLLEYVCVMTEFRNEAMDGRQNPLGAMFRIDKSDVESILCLILLSLSLVMAGSGHRTTYLVLEEFRRRVTPIATLDDINTDIQYGHHMTIAMAIGFLFLGGGSMGN